MYLVYHQVHRDTKKLSMFSFLEQYVFVSKGLSNGFPQVAGIFLPDLGRSHLAQIKREAAVSEAQAEAQAYSCRVEPGRRVGDDHEGPAEGGGKGGQEGRFPAAEHYDGHRAQNGPTEITQVQQAGHPGGLAHGQRYERIVGRQFGQIGRAPDRHDPYLHRHDPYCNGERWKIYL